LNPCAGASGLFFGRELESSLNPQAGKPALCEPIAKLAGEAGTQPSQWSVALFSALSWLIGWLPMKLGLRQLEKIEL